MSGLDKNAVIPGHDEFMRELTSFFGKLVVNPGELITLCLIRLYPNMKFPVERTAEVVMKMPKNSKGRVFLPPFDPTTASVSNLQEVTKTFF